jgi:hypothetical protein
MAARLGASFLRCALGSLNYAGSCFLASRVADGLRELAPDSLEGGYARGLAEAAQRVGIPAGEIERLLPAREVRAALARVQASHARALAMWHMHAGHLGGLLAGVAELTVDGRAPDPALCLERLAQKVVRDRALSEPFATLAADIGEWEAVLHCCRAVLDEGGALAKAYRRRRARRVAIVASVVVIALSGGVVLLQVQRWRARVEEVLAKADPCAALELTDRDLERVPSGLADEVAGRRVACEEARRREEDARAVAARRAEYEARCEALAKAVESGRLGADDAAFAGPEAALLGRVASSALEAADLGPNDPAFPCADTAAGARFAPAFRAAVVASPPGWTGGEPLSKGARAALEEHAAELPIAAKLELGLRAESQARRAIVTGVPDVLERAKRMCDLARALSVPTGGSCAGILLMQKGATR